MSYLQLDKGIEDFAQAVISLWFRLPQASVDAVVANPPHGASYYILPYTIPLITWGKPQVTLNYQPVHQNVAVWHYTPGDGYLIPVYDTPTYSMTGTNPVDPCYIGLYCLGGTPYLVFNIQMADHAPLRYARINRSRVDFYSDAQIGTLVPVPGDGWVQYVGGFSRAELVDTSYIYNAQPEYFQIMTRVLITTDHWHHLLLSFDLDATLNVGQPHATSSARLWYAIDDVDYRGSVNLGPYREPGDGLNANAILTPNIYLRSGGSAAPALYENYYIPAASGTYHPQPVPSTDAELGVPASTLYMDHIQPVEMAELQFFTGVTLDTGVAANRRAFITASGTPENPAKRPAPLPPTPPPPPGPQELLGKEAEILLHGNGNWIAGKNTGKVIKINEIGKPVSSPAENLKPTGSIVAYTPDPSLHGLQSPATAAARSLR